ncbi:hypothetical protein GCM10020229_80880 [Kitasatospora albolonga]
MDGGREQRVPGQHGRQQALDGPGRWTGAAQWGMVGDVFVDQAGAAAEFDSHRRRKAVGP